MTHKIFLYIIHRESHVRYLKLTFLNVSHYLENSIVVATPIYNLNGSVRIQIYSTKLSSDHKTHHKYVFIRLINVTATAMSVTPALFIPKNFGN